MNRRLLWLPLIGFALLLAIILSGLLRPADRTVRSAMIGKTLPAFSLPPIIAGKPGVSTALFHERRPRLINIFGSWCIPCAAEAPQLAQIRAAGVPIDAIAVRDNGTDVVDFLKRYGDPYERIGDDRASTTQLALGSSGVPESFVIDGQGRIVLQQVGPIRDDDVAGIVAAVKSAR